MTAERTTTQTKNQNGSISIQKVTLYLLMAFISLFFLLVLAGGTEGATITVDDDGGADYTSIQAAIAASENGDTIRVYEGLYEENVVMDKKLHLIGNGSESTIIDGQSEIGIVLEIKNDDITVEDITFCNGEIGLFIHDVEGITIRNCAISKNEVAGYLLCDNIDIVNTAVTENNASGLQIFGKNNHLINISADSNVILSTDSLYLSLTDTIFTTDYSDGDSENHDWTVWYDVSDSEYLNEVERDSRALAELEDVYQITLPDILLVQKKWAALTGDYENDCPIYDHNPGGNVKELDFQYDIALDDHVGGFDSANLNKIYKTNSTYLANKWLYFSDDPDVIPYFLEIENLHHAICIEGNNNYIENCEVTDNNGNGIYIHGDNNTLSYNRISRNKIGIILETSHNNIAHYNYIFDNIEYGIIASDNDDIAINATDNYWGSNTGPYHETLNPGGEGDSITDNVEFDPWGDQYSGPVWYVSVTGSDFPDGSMERPFNKLQEAIDAADEGDTIRVFEGLYEENVVIHKKLHLIGNGSESTEIDGRSEIGIVIEIKNDDITVENLTFSNGEIGLFVNDVEGITIQNCAISKNEIAGYLLCDNINITNISLTENNVSGLQIFGNHNNLDMIQVELNDMISFGYFYKCLTDIVYTTDYNKDNAWTVWYDESDDEYMNEDERDSRLLSELQDVYQIKLPDILLVQKKWVKLSGDYENDCPIYDYNPGGNVKELDFLNDVDLDSYVDGFDSASLQNIYNTNSTYLAGKWLNFSDDQDVIPYFLEIENLRHAIYIEGNNNLIEHCEVTDNNVNGVYIHGDNNTLNYNRISRNTIGIILETSHNNIAHNNNIFDNIEYGIVASNNDDIAINATHNYWGSDTGPYHETLNPDGVGDNITDNVEFDPWVGQNSGSVWYVSITGPDFPDGSKERPFHRLQDAIDASENGDTVLVYSGIYEENVVVDKSIALIGNGSDSTKITVGGFGVLMTIRADNVSINGFNLVGSENQVREIWISHTSTCTMKNNTFSDSGIYISGSEIENWNSHTIDTTNTVNGRPLYYFQNMSGFTVPSGAGQIILANCTQITVNDQNISQCSVGISIGYSSVVTLDNNIFSNNLIGIETYQSSDCFLRNNLCENNVIGTNLYFSENCILENSNYSNNSIGMYAANSNNCTIRNISCSRNYVYGIDLRQCNDCTIENTTIADNNVGIRLKDTFLDCIVHNSIYSNTEFGISTENIIDATNNYWGSNTGPYHPTLNPFGKGDNITDFVNFDPWTGKVEFYSTMFYGIVFEKDTAIGIVNALVTISDNDSTEYTIFTDENGYYEQEVEPGRYTIAAEKDGYLWYMEFEVIVIEEGESVQHNLSLEKIVESIFDVALTCSEYKLNLDKEITIYTLTLTNTGNERDSYRLILTGDYQGWNVTMEAPVTITLEPGASHTFTVVLIEDTDQNDESNDREKITVTITAISVTHEEVQDSITIEGILSSDDDSGIPYLPPAAIGFGFAAGGMIAFFRRRRIL